MTPNPRKRMPRDETPEQPCEHETWHEEQPDHVPEERSTDEEWFPE